MMHFLSPRRYGGTVAPNPDPAGNVFLAYSYSGTDDFYVGNYDGSVWTPVTTGFANELSTAMIVRAGTKVYFKYSGNFYYAEWDDVTSWTAIPQASGGSGTTIKSDGSYIYASEPSWFPSKMTLPTGPDVSIGGFDPVSRINNIYINGGNYYGKKDTESNSAKSIDGGATWSLTGAFPVCNRATVDSEDGSRIVAIYRAAAGGVEIRYSDDLTDNWSSVVHTIGTNEWPLQNDSMRFYDGKYFVVTESGKCAYSTDGATWTNGATIPQTVNNVTYCIGKIVCGCAGSKLYQTTDHGATWTEMTKDAGMVGAYLNIFWLGENP